MEIRKELYITSGKSADKAGKLNKPALKEKQPRDSVSLGGKPAEILSKPEIGKAKQTDGTAEKKYVAATTSGFTAIDAATSAMTGSAGATTRGLNLQAMKNTLENLEKSNVAFLKKRGFYIPFVTGKFAKVDAEKVAETLSEGTTGDKKNLRVQPEGLGMLPIMDEGDVQELRAFHITSATGSLPQNEIAGFLNDSVSSGMKLKGTSGENLGAYGAYNYLTTGWESADVGKQDVDLYREGTAIMKLTPDKIKDPFAVKKELKDTWDAYNTLEKYGSKYLNSVGEPVGKTSFLKRFEIFEKLNKLEQGKNDAETVYSVIAKRTDADEDFEKVADYYMDLRNKVNDRFNTMETLQAFNYSRSNLKGNPILEKAFVDIIKGTGDINETIRGLRLITTPIANETFSDRRDAMQMLTDTAGKDGVTAFELASQYMLPGETIRDSAKEYTELIKDLSYHGEKHASRAFVYMRTELKDEKEQREIFKGLFRTLCNQFETVKMMNSLKTPFRDTTYKERAEVMAKLLQNTDAEQAREDFEFLKGQTGKNEKFSEVGKLYGELGEAVSDGYYRHQQTGNAFEFVRNTLKSDKAKTASFTKLLRAGKDTDKSIRAYKMIQKPVKGENYKMREEVAVKLLEYDDFKENYEEISTHIYSGEDLGKVTDQFLAIHEAMGKDSYTNKTREAFIDMKEKSKNDRVKFDRYINLLKEFKNFDAAKKAQGLLEKPVRNESYEDREKVLLDMFKWEDGSDNAGKDSVDNYETLVKNLDKDESLPEAQKRFKLLFDVLEAREKSEDVRDAFEFVGEHARKGTFPGWNAREITNELVKSLLISDSIEDAREHLLYQAKKDDKESEKTIKHEDDYVIIGGVKLRKKK